MFEGIRFVGGLWMAREPTRVESLDAMIIPLT